MLKNYAAEQDLPTRPARLPTPWLHRQDVCPSGAVLAPVNEQALPKQPSKLCFCCQRQSHPFSHPSLGLSQAKAASAAWG